MLTKKILLALSLVITIFSCNQKDNRQSPDMAESKSGEMVTDTVSNAYVPSSAGVEKNKDSTRKFIRTAELKFKVKSVIKSTYDIEDITTQQGGFVTYTNLASNVDNVTTTAISADSSLETTYYTVSNAITIRVPNIKLDTTLKEISKNIDYLDYRLIKADDVALQILANNLVQKRATKNQGRLTSAIDKRGKKLAETTNAEELLLSREEQADNAKISNLSLADQINFSTISINIYQRPTIKRELISNNKNIDEYKPGFGKKIFEALKFGWDILEAFIIFLIKLWGLFLFIFVAYVLYKMYFKKYKK